MIHQRSSACTTQRRSVYKGWGSVWRWIHLQLETGKVFVNSEPADFNKEMDDVAYITHIAVHEIPLLSYYTVYSAPCILRPLIQPEKKWSQIGGGLKMEWYLYGWKYQSHDTDGQS